MPALLSPQQDDVIIWRQPCGTFTAGIGSGTPQIVCKTFLEALQRTSTFASTKHVRLWYAGQAQKSGPLTDITLLGRIWKEYMEMPGLRLTLAQARRLWMVDADSCASLVNILVDLNFLARGPDGRYGRFVQSAEAVSHNRMAKADLTAKRPARTLAHMV